MAWVVCSLFSSPNPWYLHELNFNSLWHMWKELLDRFSWKLLKKLGVWHFIAILNNGFRKPKNYFFHIHDIIFDYTHDLIHENMIIQENFGSGGWALMKCYIYFSTPHAHPNPNGFIEHLVQKHLFNLSVILRGRWQHVKGTNGSLLGIRLYLKKKKGYIFQTPCFNPFYIACRPSIKSRPIKTHKLQHQRCLKYE